MIQIEINRYTIKKLEKALEKYNKENNYNVYDYVDVINNLLDEYLKKKENKKE